jgi:alkylation response protein AidB-like acyl-CoA dehydrogenase
MSEVGILRAHASLALVRLPREDEALRPQVRTFLAESLAGRTIESGARSWLGFDAAFSRALGERGWLGLNLPRAYGGQERGPFARFVVVEELLAAGAPVAAHWIADRQSAPLILRCGTESQRRFFLPRICRGEAFFCIGMSEPNAGSDLANVRSQAERTPGGWRLNGRKIWTTHADRAHYMIALVRTSGTSADRHNGLSQLIVDLSLPGVTVQPIVDITGDAHFSEVHFDNVDLSEEALLGAEGAGWEQVTAELALERSGPERIYSSVVLLDAWVERLKASGVRDTAAATLLGRLIGELAVLRALSIAVTAKLANGESPTLAASLVKDMGTEFEQRIPTLLGELIGARPEAAADPALYRTLLYVSHIGPSFSLRGGTREILRGIIARGLGLR